MGCCSSSQNTPYQYAIQAKVKKKGKNNADTSDQGAPVVTFYKNMSHNIIQYDDDQYFQAKMCFDCMHEFGDGKPYY